MESTDLTFQLIVTNADGTPSEPDEVKITVNPVSTNPPEEEPRTIQDIIKSIIQNPLDITNSLDSANEIKDILTDNNRDNDQTACSLLENLDSKEAINIRDILNC